MIKTDIIGKIIKGDDTDSWVKIQKTENGFLIHVSSDAGFIDSSDDWVQNEYDLEEYFNESNWVIEWN
jgi:hypothetical protein